MIIKAVENYAGHHAPHVLYIVESPIQLIGQIDIHVIGEYLLEGLVYKESNIQVHAQTPIEIKPKSKRIGIIFNKAQIVRKFDTVAQPLDEPKNMINPEFEMFRAWAHELGLILPSEATHDSDDDTDDGWDELPIDYDTEEEDEYEDFEDEPDTPLGDQGGEATGEPEEPQEPEAGENA